MLSETRPHREKASELEQLLGYKEEIGADKDELHSIQEQIRLEKSMDEADVLLQSTLRDGEQVCTMVDSGFCSWNSLVVGQLDGQGFPIDLKEAAHTRGTLIQAVATILRAAKDQDGLGCAHEAELLDKNPRDYLNHSELSMRGAALVLKRALRVTEESHGKINEYLFEPHEEALKLGLPPPVGPFGPELRLLLRNTGVRHVNLVRKRTNRLGQNSSGLNLGVSTNRNATLNPFAALFMSDDGDDDDDDDVDDDAAEDNDADDVKVDSSETEDGEINEDKVDHDESDEEVNEEELDCESSNKLLNTPPLDELPRRSVRLGDLDQPPSAEGGHLNVQQHIGNVPSILESATAKLIEVASTSPIGYEVRPVVSEQVPAGCTVNMSLDGNQATCSWASQLGIPFKAQNGKTSTSIFVQAFVDTTVEELCEQARRHTKLSSEGERRFYNCGRDFDVDRLRLGFCDGSELFPLNVDACCGDYQMHAQRNLFFYVADHDSHILASAKESLGLDRDATDVEVVDVIISDYVQRTHTISECLLLTPQEDFALRYLKVRSSTAVSVTASNEYEEFADMCSDSLDGTSFEASPTSSTPEVTLELLFCGHTLVKIRDNQPQSTVGEILKSAESHLHGLGLISVLGSTRIVSTSTNEILHYACPTTQLQSLSGFEIRVSRSPLEVIEEYKSKIEDEMPAAAIALKVVKGMIKEFHAHVMLTEVQDAALRFLECCDDMAPQTPMQQCSCSSSSCVKPDYKCRPSSKETAHGKDGPGSSAAKSVLENMEEESSFNWINVFRQYNEKAKAEDGKVPKRVNELLLLHSESIRLATQFSCSCVSRNGQSCAEVIRNRHFKVDAFTSAKISQARFEQEIESSRAQFLQVYESEEGAQKNKFRTDAVASKIKCMNEEKLVGAQGKTGNVRWDFFFLGTKVCKETWANFHGVSISCVHTACQKAKSGDYKDKRDIDLFMRDTLRAEGINSRIETEKAFFVELGTTLGEHMPADGDAVVLDPESTWVHQDDIFEHSCVEASEQGQCKAGKAGSDLPDTQGLIRLVQRDIYSIYSLYCDFCDGRREKSFSLSYFRFIWKTDPHLKKYKRARQAANFGICSECERFKRELINTRLGTEERTEVKRQFNNHVQEMKRQRESYERRKKKAQENPGKCMSVTLDCMTHAATTIPHPGSARLGKDLNGKERYGQKLQGVIFHGRGTHFYSAHDGLSQGANFTVECLHSALSAELKEIGDTGAQRPSVLYVQADNVSDNKSHVLFDYAAFLVKTGIFKKVKICFLKPGHTHIDIDQKFSVINRHLKRQGTDAFTPSRFQSALISAWKDPSNRPKVVCALEVIHDWRKFLESKCRKYARYGCSESSGDALHCFIFRKMADSGAVLMYYKEWPTDVGVRPMPYTYGQSIPPPADIESSSSNASVESQVPVSKDAAGRYLWKVRTNRDGKLFSEFTAASPGILVIDGGITMSISEVEVEHFVPEFCESLPKIKATLKYIFENKECSLNPSTIKYTDAIAEWDDLFCKHDTRLKEEELGHATRSSPLPLPLPLNVQKESAAPVKANWQSTESEISQVDIMTGTDGKGSTITSSKLRSAETRLAGKNRSTVQRGSFGLAVMSDMDPAARTNVELANYLMCACLFQVLEVDSEGDMLTVQWYWKASNQASVRGSYASGKFLPWIIKSEAKDVPWIGTLAAEHVSGITIEVRPEKAKDRKKPPSEWKSVYICERYLEAASAVLKPKESSVKKQSRKHVKTKSVEVDVSADSSDEVEVERTVKAGTIQDSRNAIGQVMQLRVEQDNWGAGHCLQLSFATSRVADVPGASYDRHKAINEAAGEARLTTSKVFNSVACALEEIMSTSTPMLHSTSDAAEIKRRFELKYCDYFKICNLIDEMSTTQTPDAQDFLNADVAAGWEAIKMGTLTFFNSDKNGGDAHDAITYMRVRGRMHEREANNVRTGRSTTSQWGWANASDAAALALGTSTNIWCIRTIGMFEDEHPQLLKFPACSSELWNPGKIAEQSSSKRRRKIPLISNNYLYDHVSEISDSQEQIVVRWRSVHFTSLLPKAGSGTEQSGAGHRKRQKDEAEI